MNDCGLPLSPGGSCWSMLMLEDNAVNSLRPFGSVHTTHQVQVWSQKSFREILSTNWVQSENWVHLMSCTQFPDLSQTNEKNINLPFIGHLVIEQPVVVYRSLVASGVWWWLLMGNRFLFLSWARDSFQYDLHRILLCMFSGFMQFDLQPWAAQQDIRAWLLIYHDDASMWRSPVLSKNFHENPI